MREQSLGISLENLRNYLTGEKAIEDIIFKVDLFRIPRESSNPLSITQQIRITSFMCKTERAHSIWKKLIQYYVPSSFSKGATRRVMRLSTRDS